MKQPKDIYRFSDENTFTNYVTKRAAMRAMVLQNGGTVYRVQKSTGEITKIAWGEQGGFVLRDLRGWTTRELTRGEALRLYA